MRYAISDLHGCPRTFHDLLRTIDFTADDELFLLGDYVDRGPDSVDVIRSIERLRMDGHTIHCLRGNHEQMLIDALRSGRPTWDYQPDPVDVPWLLPWLEALPHYRETPGYLLVHAGVNTAHPSPLQDTHSMLWLRGWYDSLDTDWLGDRIIVHGHTPERVVDVRRGIREMRTVRRVCIDSGCAMRVEGMGYLTALNLDTGEGTDVRRRD